MVLSAHTLARGRTARARRALAIVAAAVAMLVGCAGQPPTVRLPPRQIMALPGGAPVVAVGIHLQRARKDPLLRMAVEEHHDASRLWPRLHEARQVDLFIWLDASRQPTRWEALILAYGLQAAPGPDRSSLVLDGVGRVAVAMRRIDNTTWMIGIHTGRRWQAALDGRLEPHPIELEPEVMAAFEFNTAQASDWSSRYRVAQDAPGLLVARGQINGALEGSWLELEGDFETEAEAVAAEGRIRKRYPIVDDTPDDPDAPLTRSALQSILRISLRRTDRTLTMRVRLARWAAQWLQHR
ncbi:MAG: hypothetical protein JW940_09080 [Polyangiaceae bacterium]|nr:hypothetical protein [Polyangiaceae bacterium]